ncbi:MAG TPA: glycosyltransferase [Solirubrobacteraceae bacterium]|nr:glycosyltransferase [Solirubrobacteraceae bacterium]
MSRPADLVMILENCGYSLDSRVLNEAESLLESGLSVEVLSPREPDRPRREVINGVRVTRFPVFEGHGELLGTAIEYLGVFCFVAPAVLTRLLRSRRGTLHVHNPPDMFFPLLMLARLRGWTTVFDLHDDAAGMVRARLGRPTALESLMAWMQRQSARSSDLTITTNQTQRTLVERVASRVVVVRNAPPDWFADHKPSPPAGRARLVFLGELGIQDGAERTLDILSLLVNERQLDVELLVIGEGRQRHAVEERAALLGLSDRLTITGWVPYERVPELLASAHVGLDTAPMTDVNQGSTMVKIVEYLVVGLPVVATALRETRVTGGDAVIAIDDGDVEAFVAPIARLLTDREAWRAAAELASARGEELRWAAQAAVLRDAYRDLRRSGRAS